MKAKKLMGMIACAGACVSLSSFANTNTNWFDVAVSSDVLTLTGVGTNGVAITLDDNKIVLDNDFASKLEFAPTTASPALSDGLVTIAAVAELTPSSTNDLEVFEGAKAGFAVGVDDQNATNYYGYANGAWTKLTGVNPPDSGNTEFKLVIDYRVPNVTYFVKPSGGSSYEQLSSPIALASGTTGLASIDAFGSGSLTSVDADYEIAVAIGKDGKKYGSTVEAVNTTGEGTIQVVDAETGSAAAEQVAANGIKLWECDILNVAPDAAIALEPANKGIEGKIALKLAVDPDPGVTVQFDVKQGESIVGSSYPADAIGIPLTTGTYTIVPSISAASN